MRRHLRPRGRSALCVVALCAAALAGAAEPTTAPSPVLSPISEAVDLIAAAAKVDAGLRAAQARARGAEAAGRFAGQWDDPRLALEGGRVSTPGDDDWHGRAEVTQRLPLGGEGAARSATAEGQRALANAEYALARLALASDVRRLISDLRLVSAHHTAATTSLADATAAFDAVRARLATGEARQADLLAAEVDRDEADEAVRQATQRTTAARAALARRCGVAETTIGDLRPLVLSERDRATVLTAAATHPRLLGTDAQVRAAQANAAAIRAGRWGDVHAGVFAERDGDASEVGLIVELPLPLWNRQQAPIASAEAEVAATIAQREQAQRQVEAEAETAWFAWDAARQRATRLSERLVPSAAEALRLALADYAAGKADLASVLSARRTRSRIAADAAEAVAARDRALIDLHAVAPGPEDLP